MFGSSASPPDWRESNAVMIDTIANLLTRMSDESQVMQNAIGDAVASDDDPKEVLLKLQRLDFHTQKQEDLARVLRVLAAHVRQGEYDADMIEGAANLQELRDAISQRPRRKSKRRFSIGRIELFD